MEKTAWLISVEEKFQKIAERRLFDKPLRSSLYLHILLDIAEKIEMHSSDCNVCQGFKDGILEYVNEVEFFLNENRTIKRVDDINISSQRRLRKSCHLNLKPARNHLMNTHGYYLHNTFKVRFTFYITIIGLILYFLNLSYWHLASSIALAIIGYLIGDIVNKKYEKKGRIIRVFNFRKHGLLSNRRPNSIRRWFLRQRN